jgi:hypothetical protein
MGKIAFLPHDSSTFRTSARRGCSPSRKLNKSTAKTAQISLANRLKRGRKEPSSAPP